MRGISLHPTWARADAIAALLCSRSNHQVVTVFQISLLKEKKTDFFGIAQDLWKIGRLNADAGSVACKRLEEIYNTIMKLVACAHTQVSRLPATKNDGNLGHRRAILSPFGSHAITSVAPGNILFQ